MTMAYTALSIASRGKNLVNLYRYSVQVMWPSYDYWDNDVVFSHDGPKNKDNCSQVPNVITRGQHNDLTQLYNGVKLSHYDCNSLLSRC